ncbi:MAG: hypothetical protein M3R57_06010 [Chloroflexota bacterium]|nr:hypothetical protein [Chloroflexota bacterium]
MIAGLLAVCWIAAGCGAFAVERYATNDDIRGPWRTTPLSVDPATVVAAQRACHLANGPVEADGLQLAGGLVDARGSGRLTLIYIGPGDTYSECPLDMDVRGNLSPGGNFSGASGGVADLLPANRARIVAAGMSGPVAGSTMLIGRIGAAVAAVRVATGGTSVQASVADGWFIAWWPGDEGDFVVELFDATGQKVGEARI